MKQDDVFALGTVLYEMYSGALLFNGLSDGEIRSRFLERRFPDLSDVEMPLRGVIEKCWTMPGYTAAEPASELGMTSCAMEIVCVHLTPFVELDSSGASLVTAITSTALFFALVAWRLWRRHDMR